ncbi:MAG: hypothetical protein E7Z89_05320 [Cyanobacteria bacterium SIG28]|nr:hypothetical protein [Cyanobacteria bacterium SIG28]
MTISKIIFTSDFLYHSPIDGIHHYWCIDMLTPIIEYVTNKQVVDINNIKNKQNEFFSREKFFALSGIINIPKIYYNYDVSKLKQASFDYLQSFLDKDTLIIGVELGKEIRDIFTKLDIPYISFWFHSWKLFDDTFFMLNTNRQSIFDVLQKYKVPKYKFDFYAKYYTQWTKNDEVWQKLKILKKNSVLFVGQTLQDKSTDRDGIFLNILHFKKRMEELSKDYSKIYYLAHPYVTQNKEIENYIEDTLYIKKITDIPTYHMLMSEQIRKVVSISSSVLYEAQFFKKEVEYLYKPLHNIDGRFEDDTWISIYQDYFNPIFWKEIFAPFMEVNENCKDENWFFESKNKTRDIGNRFHGYSAFDRLSKEMQKLQKGISDNDQTINYLMQRICKQGL